MFKALVGSKAHPDYDDEADDVKSDRPILAASIEIAPGQIEGRPELLKLIPPATRTYIVDLGTKSPKEWAALCRQLANHGLEPVPHIAARRLTSTAELNDRLAAMSEHAGVRDALLIAGEADEVGPFTSSTDVLETELLDRNGIKRMGIAGHPEGHATLSDTAADDVVFWKQTFAERTDADMRIVTQFGFEAAAAIGWAARLQAAGAELPVHLGLAGPATITNLLKYAAMCGVEASSRFLARNGSKVASLLTTHSPEPYVQPVEEHVAVHPACLIKQFHVFPFGGIARASEWLCERGSWSSDSRAVFEKNGAPLDLGSTGIELHNVGQKFG